MGCGASSATQTETPSSPTKFDESKEKKAQESTEANKEKKGNEKRSEVLGRYKLSEKEKSRVITFPVFKIPTKYLEEEHKIECIFLGTKDETCTDVTLFFCDKDMDEVVERQGVTFSLNKSDDKTSYERVAFDHTWAGTDTWETPINEESHTHTEPYENFEQEEAPSPISTDIISRPVVYINTATHLFSNTDTNNCTEHTTIAQFPIYSGNARQATEIMLKAAEAAHPEKKEVSPLAQLITVRTTHVPPKKKAEKEKKKAIAD